MVLRFFSAVILLGSVLIFFAGCEQRKAASLDEALALFRENNLEEALPLFEQLAKSSDENPEPHAWLAETYRRLGKKKEAIESARQALTINSRHSFAHLVIAEAANPLTGEWEEANSDTTWLHLTKAIESDPTDGNPWLLAWGQAIQRGDAQMVHKAQRQFAETGFLTKTALLYGRWMLRALPENAILITNGDMDTYPPLAVQETEQFRRDVAIVNRGILNTAWYARFIRDNWSVPLPVNDAQLEQLRVYKDEQGNLVTVSDQIFHAWLKQRANRSLARPIAVAATVDENYWSGVKSNMRYAGAFLEWQDLSTAKMPDSSAMRRSLEGLSPEDFAGPWVSERDRSPIRRVYTKTIVRNVTAAAIEYSDLLIKANRLSEAGHWQKWAEDLESKTEAGPMFADRIRTLKEALSKEIQQ